jgi:hypothetical protein
MGCPPNTHTHTKVQEKVAIHEDLVLLHREDAAVQRLEKMEKPQYLSLTHSAPQLASVAEAVPTYMLHTYTYTYIHTYIHTYTHTHMYT